MRIKIRLPIVTIVSISACVLFAGITVILNRHTSPDSLRFELGVLLSIFLGASAGAHWIVGAMPARFAIGCIILAAATMGQRYAGFVYESVPTGLSRSLVIGTLVGAVVMLWGIRRQFHDTLHDFIEDDGAPD